jgi:hypothetical protein
VTITVVVKINHESEGLLEYRVDETDLRRWVRGIEFPVQVLAVVILSDALFVPPGIETGKQDELPPV